MRPRCWRCRALPRGAGSAAGAHAPVARPLPHPRWRDLRAWSLASERRVFGAEQRRHAAADLGELFADRLILRLVSPQADALVHHLRPRLDVVLGRRAPAKLEIEP